MRNKFITNVFYLDMDTLIAFMKSLDRVVSFQCADEHVWVPLALVIFLLSHKAVEGHYVL